MRFNVRLHRTQYKIGSTSIEAETQAEAEDAAQNFEAKDTRLPFTSVPHHAIKSDEKLFDSVSLRRPTQASAHSRQIGRAKSRSSSAQTRGFSRSLSASFGCVWAFSIALQNASSLESRRSLSPSRNCRSTVLPTTRWRRRHAASRSSLTASSGRESQAGVYSQR